MDLKLDTFEQVGEMFDLMNINSTIESLICNLARLRYSDGDCPGSWSPEMRLFRLWFVRLVIAFRK